MPIDYHDRQILQRFVKAIGKMLFLCGPTGNASSLPTRRLDGNVYIEVGELKAVVNLLRENATTTRVLDQSINILNSFMR